MKPTLLVLAAGMGSRYGGLKQMDGLGPNNHRLFNLRRGQRRLRQGRVHRQGIFPRAVRADREG